MKLKNYTRRVRIGGTKIRKHQKNPYDLSEGFKGFNIPCPKCGKEIDRRSSPYEPTGFIDFCKCN